MIAKMNMMVSVGGGGAAACNWKWNLNHDRGLLDLTFTEGRVKFAQNSICLEQVF
jgi:hypothetical protein